MKLSSLQNIYRSLRDTMNSKVLSTEPCARALYALFRKHQSYSYLEFSVMKKVKLLSVEVLLYPHRAQISRVNPNGESCLLA